MKNNFFKKLFGNDVVAEAKDIKEELKNTLRNRWAKQAKASEINFDELYEQMVEEAVLVIKDAWKQNAEHGTELKYPVNEVKLEAYNAFFITEARNLYSSNASFVRNPKTGKACFFSAFTFPNDGLIEQYVTDVLERLPEGTEYNNIKTNDVFFGPVNKYSFTISITNLQD